MKTMMTFATSLRSISVLLAAAIGAGIVQNVVGEEAPGEGTLLGDAGGFRTSLASHGLEFGAQYLAEGAANVSGGAEQGSVYNGLLTITGDADLEKLAGWSGGKLHLGILATHGRSLTDKYVNDLYVLSNIDASDNARLQELWFEQALGENFSVRLGQISVDAEFAFTDYGALFNNSAFGWFPIVGATAPVYPQGAPGVRLKWQGAEGGYLQYAITDGDVNPADDDGGESNPNGTRFKLDEGAFMIAESGVQLDCGGRPLSLKLGGWYHTADADDVRNDDAGLSLADPASSGTPETHDGNWGAYACAEKQVWKENPSKEDDAQGLGAFARIGYEPGDRNVLENYLECGLVSTGLLPGRDDDVCGLGLAFGRISRDLRDLGRDARDFGGSDPLPDYETVAEFEYNVAIRPGIAVQPGAQYILHPGGSSALDDAFVLNLRATLDF